MRTVLASVLALALAACGAGEVPEGMLRLSPEGISGDRMYQVDSLEFWVFNLGEMKDTFELRGPDIAVVGTLWSSSGLEAPGALKTLEGKVLTIEPRGGNPKGRRDSSVKIEELGKSIFSVGFLAIDRVEDVGGKTVLTGRLERYTLDTEKGQKRGSGAFKVQAKVSSGR